MATQRLEKRELYDDTKMIERRKLERSAQLQIEDYLNLIQAQEYGNTVEPATYINIYFTNINKDKRASKPTGRPVTPEEPQSIKCIIRKYGS